MNIMFLIFSYNTGGIERLLIDMANELSARKQHIFLCIINDNYDNALLANYSDQIQIIKLKRPCHKGKRLPYMIRLAKLIRHEHIQILHCQDLNCTIFALLAKILHPSLSIIDTVHDTFAFAKYSFIKVKLEQLLCKRIIAISKSVKLSIMKRNIPENKICVIYNAINTHKFPLTPKPRNSEVTLGNVARIMPKVKGQLILLEALILLKEKYPHIVCKFAGVAAPDQLQEYQELLSFVENHALASNVIFCGDVKDVPAFLEAIDIFVLPSIHEGFGISLIEAMSMGIPCIASNIAGPAEIISDESLGVLFESQSSVSLAEKIDYTISHYNLFDNTHISAYIESHFSIANMTDTLISLYQSLL